MVSTTWPVLIAYLMQLSFIALASYVCPSTACLIPFFEVAVIFMLLTTVLTDAK